MASRNRIDPALEDNDGEIGAGYFDLTDDLEDERRLPKPLSKMVGNMAARRRADDWWEARRLHDDDWDIDYFLERKQRRGKSWRRHL